jgi:hypothetical protein
MTLESLLLSQDAEVVRVLRPTLEKLSIEVEICQDARKASEILIAEKFWSACAPHPATGTP